MKVVPTGTPNVAGTTGQWQLSIEFESTTAKESGYSGAPFALNTTSTVRNGVFAGYSWTTNAGTTTHNVAAAAGDLKEAKIRLSGSPGSGKSYVFNMYKNGTKQDGTGGTVDTTITIADAATEGTWSGTLSLAAGDTIYWECVPSGTPTLRSAAYGVRFLASTNGESQFSGIDFQSINTVNVTYSQIQSRDDDWDTTEGSNDMKGGVNSFTLKKLYVVLTGDPSPGEYVFTLRRNNTSPGGTVTATVTSGNTTANDTSNSLVIADGDTFTIQADPNSSPTGRAATWSFVQLDTTATAGYNQLVCGPPVAGYLGKGKIR